MIHNCTEGRASPVQYLLLAAWHLTPVKIPSSTKYFFEEKERVSLFYIRPSLVRQKLGFAVLAKHSGHDLFTEAGLK